MPSGKAVRVTPRGAFTGLYGRAIDSHHAPAADNTPPRYGYRLYGYRPDLPEAFAFISCLCARTLASDSGPVMSATERKDRGSP